MAPIKRVPLYMDDEQYEDTYDVTLTGHEVVGITQLLYIALRYDMVDPGHIDATLGICRKLVETVLGQEAVESALEDIRSKQAEDIDQHIASLFGDDARPS